MDRPLGWAAQEELRAVAFTGSLREYLPIAATNTLLTIVTLGIYRFWAKARTRRYLWSHTRVIDDTLEWSGTGKEMFVGFLLVALCLLPIGLFAAFGLPALAARLRPEIVAVLAVLLYPLVLGLVAFARFRALRYRLSRSWWHGVRGGSEHNGHAYAGRAILSNLASYITALLLYPWAQTRQWNQRWRSMSFGSLSFVSELRTADTRGAWMVFWFTLAGASVVLSLFADPQIIVYGPGAPWLVIPVLFYLLLGLAYLHYAATFYSSALDAMRLGELEFGFEAEHGDWVAFHAATIGLAIVTLGLAMLIYDYRKWRFMTKHLRIYGELDLAALRQSSTRSQRDAEGFAESFDLGAF
jgi:uncharacterized membrane protein YjgN (DUF898 family)